MKTKEDFFKFEKDKQIIFNTYYKRKGWKVKRVNGKENKKFNCLVDIGGKLWKFEEKARSKDWNDLLVEITQDAETNSPGWIYYSEADYILYSTPDNFYAINFKKLKKYVEKYGENYNFIISDKGWGKTINIAIPWELLIKNNIAKKVKK